MNIFLNNSPLKIYKVRLYKYTNVFIKIPTIIEYFMYPRLQKEINYT